MELLILWWGLPMLLAGYAANKRGRSVAGMILLTLLIGWFAVPVPFFLKDKSGPSETDQMKAELALLREDAIEREVERRLKERVT